MWWVQLGRQRAGPWESELGTLGPWVVGCGQGSRRGEPQRPHLSGRYCRTRGHVLSSDPLQRKGLKGTHPKVISQKTELVS